MDVANEGNECQPIFRSAHLSAHLKQSILDLLKKFKNVSTWTYVEMPRLDPQLVKINLIIEKELDQSSRPQGTSSQSSRCR